ncbi:hypothetical protein LguiB_021139 [Lonicera macranthoides]
MTLTLEVIRMTPSMEVIRMTQLTAERSTTKNGLHLLHTLCYKIKRRDTLVMSFAYNLSLYGIYMGMEGMERNVGVYWEMGDWQLVVGRIGHASTLLPPRARLQLALYTFYNELGRILGGWFSFTIASRLLVIALIILWRNLLSPYYTTVVRFPRIASAIEESIVWDGVYFVRIAECGGYEYEQSYAFLPLLIISISFLSTAGLLERPLPWQGPMASAAKPSTFKGPMEYVLTASTWHRARGAPGVKM